jgi:type I restriction enzyme S subunit
MSDQTSNWPEKVLRDLFDLARQPVTPGAYPKEEFAHYSIPAWDEKRGPAVELGSSIGSSKIAITQPTILVSKLNPRIRRVVHVENPSGLRHCASTEFMPYVAKSDSVVLQFYKWFFESQLFQRKLERIATGSTNSHKRARPSETLGWNIPAPLPDDQRRVAAVLDTVDEAIANTEAVIAKLRQLRAGLLYDLLTCGLDAHGQLRDPIAHPEQFQDSLLGRIPREWDVMELRECYAAPSRNGLYKRASSYGFGPRMVHMPQMFKGVFVDVDDAVRVDVDPPELQNYALQEGDILFARRSLNLEGAGLCSMIGQLREPITFESSIVRVRTKLNVIVPRFAVEFLRSPSGYRLRRRFIRQVAVSGVSSDDIAHFLVPCPKLPEQQNILCLLDAQDSAIRFVTEEAAKLAQLKSGLMADLLIGRVRVPETGGGTS